jgi:hypothetical protein
MSGKRLRQKSGAADFTRLFSYCWRIKRRHENDRDRGSPCGQPSPHLDTGYTAHMNIENDASHIGCRAALKKSLAGFEGFGLEVVYAE